MSSPTLNPLWVRGRVIDGAPGDGAFRSGVVIPGRVVGSAQAGAVIPGRVVGSAQAGAAVGSCAPKDGQVQAGAAVGSCAPKDGQAQAGAAVEGGVVVGDQVSQQCDPSADIESSSEGVADSDALVTLMSMGFERSIAMEALSAAEGELTGALELLGSLGSTEAPARQSSGFRSMRKSFQRTVSLKSSRCVCSLNEDELVRGIIFRWASDLTWPLQGSRFDCHGQAPKIMNAVLTSFLVAHAALLCTFISLGVSTTSDDGLCYDSWVLFYFVSWTGGLVMLLVMEYLADALHRLTGRDCLGLPSCICCLCYPVIIYIGSLLVFVFAFAGLLPAMIRVFETPSYGDDWGSYRLELDDDYNDGDYVADGSEFYINCTDSNWGSVDVDGDGCSVYAHRPGWCGSYDDDDFSSEEMCCACSNGDDDADDDAVLYYTCRDRSTFYVYSLFLFPFVVTPLVRGLGIFHCIFMAAKYVFNFIPVHYGERSTETEEEEEEKEEEEEEEERSTETGVAMSSTTTRTASAGPRLFVSIQTLFSDNHR